MSGDWGLGAGSDCVVNSRSELPLISNSAHAHRKNAISKSDWKCIFRKAAETFTLWFRFTNKTWGGAENFLLIFVLAFSQKKGTFLNMRSRVNERTRARARLHSSPTRAFGELWVAPHRARTHI